MGKTYITYDPISGQRIKVFCGSGIGHLPSEAVMGTPFFEKGECDVLSEYLAAEIARGNLVMKRSDADSLIEKMGHRRFSQFHMGIPVFGYP